MSVLRVALRARPQTVRLLPAQRRSAHSDEHHEEQHDSAEYPKEGFSGPFWRKTTLLAIVLFGAVNFAPTGLLKSAPLQSDDDDEPWLTRVFAANAPSTSTWTKANETHLDMAEDIARENRLVHTARRPSVHRFRYPLMFDQTSPHCLPIGGSADLKGLVVKSDQDAA